MPRSEKPECCRHPQHHLLSSHYLKIHWITSGTSLQQANGDVTFNTSVKIDLIIWDNYYHLFPKFLIDNDQLHQSYRNIAANTCVKVHLGLITIWIEYRVWGLGVFGLRIGSCRGWKKVVWKSRLPQLRDLTQSWSSNCCPFRHLSVVCLWYVTLE